MCNNKFDTVFLCPGFFVSGAPMDICCKRFSRRRSARWRRAGPELGGVCVCWSSTRLCRSASGCRRGCKSDLYKCAELWNRLSLSVKLGWILISMIDRLFIAEIWSWWQTSVLTDIMKRKKAPGCNKDDATGSSHTGKAENPEEDPAKVLAHLSFLLLQSFEVCVFVQTLCLLFVFHLSSTIATYFQSSATWEAFLTPEKYNDRDHDTGSGSCFHDDGDGDLVVSVLILDMLGNEAHRVDRFLKMRLLTKLTLSQSIVTIVTILFLY